MSTAELDTKQNWDDCHFDQYSQHSIHLSGCTVICGQLKINSPTGFTSCVGAGSGKLWTSDASGMATWQDPIESQNITRIVCQPSHGFGCGTVLGFSGGTYNKPKADGNYNGEVLGIVSKCYNASCFDITQGGFVTGLTGLIASCTYFLSDATPGLLTTTEPSTPGHVSKSVIVATSTTSGWVLPYPGYIISSGGTGGSGTLTGATNGVCKYNSTNVCLGGDITGSILLCGNGSGKNLNICTIQGNCNNITNFCGGIFASNTCDLSTTWKSCLTMSGFAQLSTTNNPATQCNVMDFRPDAVYLTIGGTSIGPQYAADYCTKFNSNCRSIPDVDWVRRYVTANTTASMSGTACHVSVFNAAGNNVCNTTMTFISNVLCNNNDLTIEVPNGNIIYLSSPNTSTFNTYIGIGKPSQSATITNSVICAVGANATQNLQVYSKGVASYLLLAGPTTYIGSVGSTGFRYFSGGVTLPQNANMCGYGGNATVPDATPTSLFGGNGYFGGGCSGNGGDLNVCAGNALGVLSKIGGNLILSAGAGANGGANGLICFRSQACASSTITASNFILSSDCRLKTWITPINMSPINVDYKQFIMDGEPNQLRYGVIAQDLQTINPELVRCDSNGMLSVAYIDLLVREVAYLKCKIIELENKIG